MGFNPGSGRYPGEGNGIPQYWYDIQYDIQYSGLKNHMAEDPGGLQSMGSQRFGHNWARTCECLESHPVNGSSVIWSESSPFGRKQKRFVKEELWSGNWMICIYYSACLKCGPVKWNRSMFRNRSKHMWGFLIQAAQIGKGRKNLQWMKLVQQCNYDLGKKNIVESVPYFSNKNEL